MSAKTHLTLISNNLSHEQRIQCRIDSFCRDIMEGDGSMEYVQQILEVIYDYLQLYDDGEIVMAALRTREACYYLGDWVNYN